MIPASERYLAHRFAAYNNARRVLYLACDTLCARALARERERERNCERERYIYIYIHIRAMCVYI